MRCWGATAENVRQVPSAGGSIVATDAASWGAYRGARWHTGAPRPNRTCVLVPTRYAVGQRSTQDDRWIGSELCLGHGLDVAVGVEVSVEARAAAMIGAKGGDEPRAHLWIARQPRDRLGWSLDHEYAALGVPVWSSAFGEMAWRRNEPAVHIVAPEADRPRLYSAMRASASADEHIEAYRRDNDWAARFALIAECLGV
jgi:hypothetical protein